MKIRPVEPQDRNRIREILIGTARFTDEEVLCAVELVESAIEHPERGDYIVHVLEEPEDGPGRAVQGYTCYGPTPMTDGDCRRCDFRRCRWMSCLRAPSRW